MNTYKRSFSTFHMPKQQLHSRIRNHLIDRFLICFKTLFRFSIFLRSFALSDFIICSFLLHNSHPPMSSYVYYRYEVLFFFAMLIPFIHNAPTNWKASRFVLLLSFHLISHWRSQWTNCIVWLFSFQCDFRINNIEKRLQNVMI